MTTYYECWQLSDACFSQSLVSAPLSISFAHRQAALSITIIQHNISSLDQNYKQEHEDQKTA